MGGNRSLARGFGLFIVAVIVLGLAGTALVLGMVPAHQIDIMLLFMPLVGLTVAGMIGVWLGVAGFELMRGIVDRDR